MTVQMTPATEVLPSLFSEDEAREASRRIRRTRDSLRTLLVEFEEREGWRALGYRNMRLCAEGEWGMSWRHFARQIAAVAVDRNLGVTIGQLPESHARELAALPASEQAAAYAEASANGTPKASDVRAVVRGRRAVAPLPEPPSEPDPPAVPEPEPAPVPQDAVAPAAAPRRPSKREQPSAPDEAWTVTEIERAALLEQGATLGSVIAVYWRTVEGARDPTTRRGQVCRALLGAK